jgi:hypothetical protein
MINLFGSGIGTLNIYYSVPKLLSLLIFYLYLIIHFIKIIKNNHIFCYNLFF